MAAPHRITEATGRSGYGAVGYAGSGPGHDRIVLLYPEHPDAVGPFTVQYKLDIYRALYEEHRDRAETGWTCPVDGKWHCPTRNQAIYWLSMLETGTRKAQEEEPCVA